MEGSIVLDATFRVLHVSKPLCAKLRVAEDAVPGRSLTELLAPLLTDAEHSAKALGRWLEDAAGPPPSAFASLVLDTKDGGKHRLTLHPIGDPGWVLSLESLADASEAPINLYNALYNDGLTGTANRALFEDRLDAALADLTRGLEESITVVLLDLDRFKAVNDTLGHPTGDALLRLVAERLRSGIRESDMLARLGGDEFAILLHDNIDEQRVADLASRLIDLIQRPYLVDGHVLNIGASIGIARAPSDGRSRSHLMRNADLALYHSKGAGRGVFHFFAPLMEQRAQERRTLELDLRKALVLKQFELHYQPQVDVESRKIIGLEGLLRWQHPTRGRLLPSEFLALAEEIGLSVPIGEWVLKTACKDAATWPEAVIVAVNVSSLQFEKSGFALAAERALKAANLPGSRLEIEVTEDILLRNGDHVRATLEALRPLGVRVAMGSFGTGLASLGQVVSFPFDKIKIDRSLVGIGETDIRSRAILRAVSALGQSLGIATLAEGVETAEHLANVRAEGCQTVQGFFYSRPVPARDLAALFASPMADKIPVATQETP